MEPRRYTLVPDDSEQGSPAAGPVRRRYSLARVAPSPRSALGVDRLERMEQIVARERRSDGRPGRRVGSAGDGPARRD